MGIALMVMTFVQVMCMGYLFTLGILWAREGRRGNATVSFGMAAFFLSMAIINVVKWAKG